jgi:hypothetical protein
MLEAKNVALFFALSLALVTVIFAVNRSAGSDPRASLLVSESIIKTGTVRLDHYGPAVLNLYGWNVHKKNGHYYYFFPIGSSLASVPFVAVANSVGLEMVRSEPTVQIAIAAFTSVITLLLLIKLASLFLDFQSALLVSSIFWFGTSLASTSATALWSHNFAALFALAAIYCTVRAAKQSESQPWHLLATLLFAAYLCRPTMALLAPCLLLFVFTYSRVAALKAGLLLTALLSFFVLYSIQEFGQILPDYYLPNRFTGEHFYEALYGNLFSPARGIFIYSPFILLAWLCINYAKKSWGLKTSWLLIALVWPGLHLICISHFNLWWAGWSYGARFMTDVIPGLFLLTLYTWPTKFDTPIAKSLAAVLFVTCGFAIVVNTGQGLFNRFATAWNGEPNINQHPEYVFDWNYPQFLATRAGHASRIMRHGTRTIHPIAPGETFDHTSNVLIYLGWGRAESAHRWSDGNNPSIIFEAEHHEKFAGFLKLRVGSLGKQRVTMTLNGTKIYSGIISAWDEVLAVPFSSSLLKDGANNLAFRLPDARQPGTGDQKKLAIAIMSLQIQ